MLNWPLLVVMLTVLNVGALRLSRSVVNSRMRLIPLSVSLSGKVTSVDTGDHLNFATLGVTDDIRSALLAQNIVNPTPVQRAVIPRILSGSSLVIAAATGSGKTLAYTLPAIQEMKAEEMSGYIREKKRPRCLILVPTRELAEQVLQIIKKVGHYSKISSACVSGGADIASERKVLENMVDVVVATPQRLLFHQERGNVFLSHVNKIVIDEVDTMFVQGFGPQLRSILNGVLLRVEKMTSRANSANSTTELPVTAKLQLVMATATLTKAVRTLLAEINKDASSLLETTEASKPRNLTSNVTLHLDIVEVDGLHRSLPNVRHHFESVRNEDKLVALKNLLSTTSGRRANGRTLVFCNTVASSRAVDYALNEHFGEGKVLSYHGDLNSAERTQNLEAFRSGENSLMVCTDIAARGLDIPEISDVIMFDFPLNPIDYLHRAGRCGRAGRPGRVTALVMKRDEVLAKAIERAISKGLPLDGLSSSKRDYEMGGRLAHLAKSDRRSSSSSGPRVVSSPPSEPRVLLPRNPLFKRSRDDAAQSGSKPVSQFQGRSQSAGKGRSDSRSRESSSSSSRGIGEQRGRSPTRKADSDSREQTRGRSTMRGTRDSERSSRGSGRESVRGRSASAGREERSFRGSADSGRGRSMSRGSRDERSSSSRDTRETRSPSRGSSGRFSAGGAAGDRKGRSLSPRGAPRMNSRSSSSSRSSKPGGRSSSRPKSAPRR